MLRSTPRRLLRSIPSVPFVLPAYPRSFSSSISSSSSPTPTPTTRSTNTISADEIAHFSSLSAHWWDPTGEFGLLHRMNPSRIQFIKDSILDDKELPSGGGKWLQGMDLLDVGCGGGIFAESIARLGANTLAIDASSSNISVAQTHATLDPSLNLINSQIPRPSSLSLSQAQSQTSSSSSLEYRHCAAEDLESQGKQFDIVCAMEVIEHVQDPRGFLQCLMNLTKPGGHLLLSTISRTPLAKFLTITMAESILRLVTPGTHTYSKYLKPRELQEYFEENGWWGMEKRGCVYDPIKGQWRLLGMGEYAGLGEMVNYFAGVRKPLE